MKKITFLFAATLCTVFHMLHAQQPGDLLPYNGNLGLKTFENTPGEGLYLGSVGNAKQLSYVKTLPNGQVVFIGNILNDAVIFRINTSGNYITNSINAASDGGFIYRAISDDDDNFYALCGDALVSGGDVWVNKFTVDGTVFSKDFCTLQEHAEDLVVDNNKNITAIFTEDVTGNNYYVRYRRYDDIGTPVPAIPTNTFSDYFSPIRMAIFPNGDIIYSEANHDSDITLRKYDYINGQMPMYQGNISSLNPADGDITVMEMRMLPNGTCLLAYVQGLKLYFCCVTSDGELWPYFGTNGIQTIDLSAYLQTGFSYPYLVADIKILHNNQILVLLNIPDNLGLLRLNEDGSKDQNFGSDGLKLHNSHVDGGYFIPSKMDVLPNNTIFVGGSFEKEIYNQSQNAWVNHSWFAARKFYQEINLDIQDSKKTNWAVKTYPNPTSDFIQIETDVKFEMERYKILDITGKSVTEKNEAENSFTIDVQQFPKGIYMLELHGKNGFVTEKVVVR